MRRSLEDREVIGLLFIGALMYVLPIVFVFLKKYLEFSDSKYRKVSNHTFWETFSDKGNKGEYAIYRQLEQIKVAKVILTNLYLPKKDGTTTEIDLLMITKYGFFVVESKNYSGWVFGNEKHRYWTQTFPNRAKFKFFNPIWQNKGHISALKEVLGIEEDSLVQSLIVFGNECTLKNITVTSPEVQVMNRGRMNQIVKKEVQNMEQKLTSEDIKHYFRMLRPYIRATKVTKELHIRHVQEKASK